MKAKRVLAHAVLMLLLMSVSATAEDSFRCGSKLVSIGDSKYQVLAKCGEPSYTEVRREKKSSAISTPISFLPRGIRAGGSRKCTGSPSWSNSM